MNRKELLQLILEATGYVMISISKPVYSYVNPSQANNDLSADEVALLDETTEAINAQNRYTERKGCRLRAVYSANGD